MLLLSLGSILRDLEAEITKQAYKRHIKCYYNLPAGVCQVVFAQSYPNLPLKCALSLKHAQRQC